MKHIQMKKKTIEKQEMRIKALKSLVDRNKIIQKNVRKISVPFVFFQFETLPKDNIRLSLQENCQKLKIISKNVIEIKGDLDLILSTYQSKF